MCNDACGSERVLVPQCPLLAISATVSLTVGVEREERSGVTCLLPCSANRSMARSGRFSCKGQCNTWPAHAPSCPTLSRRTRQSDERTIRTRAPGSNSLRNCYSVYGIYCAPHGSLSRPPAGQHRDSPGFLDALFCFLWLQCAPPLSCCRVVRSHGRWPAS